MCIRDSTSPTRFFVHDTVFEQFLDTFIERASEVVVGDGMDPDVEMGPLAHDRRITALSGFVNEATEAGADLVLGGSRIDRPGYFFEPTVLANVPDEARVMKEEPFGPLAIINPVGSLDEAIAHANSAEYGLCLLYTSPSPRDQRGSRMPSSA